MMRYYCKMYDDCRMPSVSNKSGSVMAVLNVTYVIFSRNEPNSEGSYVYRYYVTAIS